jgi:transposase
MRWSIRPASTSRRDRRTICTGLTLDCPRFSPIFRPSWLTIPPKATRIEQREYEEDMYRIRHLIENFFAKLKQFRGIATRYDKRTSAFLGAIYLAASAIWLN